MDFGTTPVGIMVMLIMSIYENEGKREKRKNNKIEADNNHL